tara:strand:+ start:1315 stop:2421 length:1107 start_codon:yes stop_codon:yes gene_type:complete
MSIYLETAIALVLIFVIFSIVVYVLQEVIAINLKYRGKMLWKSLAQLLDGVVLPGRQSLNETLPAGTGAAPLTDQLFSHPQIRSLQKELDKWPSYIPAANFALAVLDLAANAAPVKQQDLFKNVQSGLTTFVNANGNAYGILKNLVDTSANVKELQAKIEDWYNEYMDRVTGWYKSHTVLTIRLIAIGVALFFNINVIKLTREIFTNTQLRTSMVAVAERVADHPETVSEFYTRTFDASIRQIDAQYKQRLDSATDAEKEALLDEIAAVKAAQADTFTKKRIAAIDSITRQLSITGLPLSWKPADSLKAFWTANGLDTFADIMLALLGWAIAAGCLSMGAPFWFDLLLKLVNVRRAGIKPGADEKRRR